MTFVLAAVTVAAVLVTLNRVIKLKKLLGLATLIDVLFSVLMLIVFAGTLGGTLVAISAGLLMAVTLSVLRKIIGFEKLTIRGWKTVEGLV
jgi:hypothetical protein